MLTVVFTTLNGATVLPRMLDSMTRLVEPSGGWQLLAVDNGSTDGSVDILRSYADKLPLTLLSEPRRGKNIALNTAIRHFKGDLVVFTDDDVIANPDWLVALQRAADHHPEADIFGGVILLEWPREPDDIIRKHIPPEFYTGTPELSDGPISPSRCWGANLAVRASLFAQGHRFREDIGPDGSKRYTMGSETEFTSRMYDAGHKCHHVSSAIVRHLIRPHQMTRKWILGRTYRQARGERRRRVKAPEQVPYFLGGPRYLLALIIKSYFKATAAWLRRDPDACFLALREANHYRGYFDEARSQRH